MLLLPPPLGEGWGGGTGPSICSLRLIKGWSRGFVPAAESLSFASPKESNQRKGDPTARDPSLRYGQPAVLAFRGVRANSLRSNTRGPDPRKAALLGTRRGEWGWGGPLLRSANNGLTARGLERVRSYACDRQLGHEHGHEYERVRVRESQRERRPRAHANLHPTQGRATARWSSNPLWPRRGAELFADKGPRVSEPKASLRGPREKRAPQVARSEAEGRGQWGRLSLVTFFGETKKVTRPPGRNPGSALNTTATYEINRTSAPTPTLPRRGGSQTELKPKPA